MNSNGKVFKPLSAYTDPPRGYNAMIAKPDRMLHLKLAGKPGEALNRMHALGWRWISNFSEVQTVMEGSKCKVSMSCSIRFEQHGVTKSKAEWEAALLDAWREVKK